MNKTHIALILTFLLLALKQTEISIVLFYLIVLIHWKDILLWLYSHKYGVPYPRILQKGNIALIDAGFLAKYSIIYAVKTVKHTVEDLTADDLWRVIKFYLSGIPILHFLRITHLAIKNGSMYKYYIKVDLYVEDGEDWKLPLSTISSFKKIIENSGIRIEPKNYERYLQDIFSHIAIDKSRVNVGIVFDIAIIVIIMILLMIKIYTFILYITPIFAINIFTIILRITKNSYKHVKVKTPIYVLKKNLSLEYVVDEEAVYQAARGMYTYMSTAKGFLIACTLKRLPSYTKESLGKRAYSLYELGTALDKLSLLAKSKFLYEVLDKRLRRGENMYETTLRFTAAEPEELMSHLDATGLIAGLSRKGGWDLYTFL